MADWEKRLDNFFTASNETVRKEADAGLPRFIRDVAVPAFEQGREKMAEHGREVTVRGMGSSITVSVQQGGAEEFSYRIHGRQFTHGILPYAEIRYRERKGLKIIRVESMIRSGPQDYAIEDVTAEEVIDNFLDHYLRAVKPG